MLSEEQITDRWVARVNAMAHEMDEYAASVHPSTWYEAMRELNERFQRLAASPPKEVAGSAD